jgi:LysM repeat protein
MLGRPDRPGAVVIPRFVLLAVTALASSLILAATNPAPTSTPAPTVPALPQTQPGLSHDEGVFLVTKADDGGSAVYFIAGNARHSITTSDMQLELQVNPLWPVRQVSPEEALNFGEGAPIGGAHTGLIGSSAAPEPQPAPDAPEPAPAAPAAPEPVPAAPQPAPAAPTSVAPAPVAADPAEPIVYVLRPGDNLTHIARDYGTTVEDILAANGITDPNRIYAGQALVIPSGATDVDADASEPAPQPAAAASVPTAVVEDPAQAADDADDASTADAQETYTVAPGDSALKIARRFGIDEDSLLQANNISNPNRVYVGQVLTIPASS